MKRNLVPQGAIINKIILFRGQKVILDSDIAQLYGVETKVLNQAVNRNKDRFPEDFMFRLTRQEFSYLKSQFVTSSLERHGGRRKLPNAFTEQGVAMLSSALRSKKAVQVNIAIMRAFVHINRILFSNAKLAEKIRKIEIRMKKLEYGNDKQLGDIYKTLKELIIQEEDDDGEPLGFDMPGVN